MSLAWVAVGTAVVGAASSMYGAGKASDSADKSTEAQAASAAQSAQLGRDQLEWNKTQYYEQKPTRDSTAAATLRLMEQQAQTSKTQSDIAADYDAYSKNTFRPLEQRIAADAAGYDTPERRAAAIAAATADTERAYSSASDSLSRALGRSGVTMGSGRAQALMQDASLAKAGAIAGATTGATRNIETIGNARMMDAASLGRNLPSAQATAANTSINAANSATNSGATAINELASGIGAVNTGYGGAMAGNATAGQLYGQVANVYGRQAAENNAWMGALGQAAGNWAGTSAGSNAIAGWLSDEKKKSDTGKKLSGKKALKSIEETPVHTGWMYDAAKGGPDDGRRHDGPMAADVQRTMPEASDGKQIDPISINGRVMAGMQELSRRIERVERRKAA